MATTSNGKTDPSFGEVIIPVLLLCYKHMTPFYFKITTSSDKAEQHHREALMQLDLSIRNTRLDLMSSFIYLETIISCCCTPDFIMSLRLRLLTISRTDVFHIATLHQHYHLSSLHRRRVYRYGEEPRPSSNVVAPDAPATRCCDYAMGQER